jgi:hypothetical protein
MHVFFRACARDCPCLVPSMCAAPRQQNGAAALSPGRSAACAHKAKAQAHASSLRLPRARTRSAIGRRKTQPRFPSAPFAFLPRPSRRRADAYISILRAMCGEACCLPSGGGDRRGVGACHRPPMWRAAMTACKRAPVGSRREHIQYVRGRRACALGLGRGGGVRAGVCGAVCARGPSTERPSVLATGPRRTSCLPSAQHPLSARQMRERMAGGGACAWAWRTRTAVAGLSLNGTRALGAAGVAA